MVKRDPSVREPWPAESRLIVILPHRLRGIPVSLEEKLLERRRHSVGCGWNAANGGHTRQAQCCIFLFYD